MLNAFYALALSAVAVAAVATVAVGTSCWLVRRMIETDEERSFMRVLVIGLRHWIRSLALLQQQLGATAHHSKHNGI